MTYLEKLEEVLPEADINQIRDIMCPGDMFGESAPIGYEGNCPYTNRPLIECRNECWEWEYKEAEE